MPLDPLSQVPFNGEAPLTALRSPVTPLESLYVRSNFPEPHLDPQAWRLEVGGAVDTPRTWSLAELQALGSPLERTVTLECAGNGRSFIEPPVVGTPWTLGATGTAVFTGVPLARVLARSGTGDGVVEWCFTGADRGEAGAWGTVPFQRSLPADAVTPGPDGPLLAWALNGRPLTVRHGAPVRLVVPGWYAVASVKWLTRIEALTEPFRGRFQTDRYLYVRDGEVLGPVTRMKVRALVLDPAEGDPVPEGDSLAASGIAWSGSGPITEVAVSVDGGTTWTPAEVDAPGERWTAQRWRWTGPAPEGPTPSVVARATDASGAVQPLETWNNDLGYGNNEVHRVGLTPLLQPAEPSS